MEGEIERIGEIIEESIIGGERWRMMGLWGVMRVEIADGDKEVKWTWRRMKEMSEEYDGMDWILGSSN